MSEQAREANGGRALPPFAGMALREARHGDGEGTKGEGRPDCAGAARKTATANAVVSLRRTPKRVRSTPPPPPPEQMLAVHISEELSYIVRMIDGIFPPFEAIPLLRNRHMLELNRLMQSRNMLIEIAKILASPDHEEAVERVALADLKARLKRRPVDDRAAGRALGLISKN
ncbi:MAG: hypothetical protein ACFBQW_06610 [Sphingomonadaceae bacterium]